MFSRSDVENLRSDPNTRRRAETADRLGRTIDSQALTAEELRAAQEVIGILAKDIEVEVRAALSSAVRHSAHLPHAVAWALANDVESVSVPVLSESLVLTNDDLRVLARRGSPAAQAAIAGRPDIGEKLSAALVTYGTEEAVSTLMHNPASRIAEQTFNEALERFPKSEAVTAGMARRVSLPVAIAERLVTMVSDELQHFLLARHNLPRALAADLALRSRESAVLRVSKGLAREHIDSLADQVATRGRLTPTLLLRALCTGDIAFFEAGMARLAAIPVGNARTLLHASGTKSFAALYKTCGLPQNLLPAFRAAIDAATEHAGAADMRDRVMERFHAIVKGEADSDVHEALACIREVTNAL